MDIWVERSTENYLKIKKAFDKFGMSVFDMNEKNFLEYPSWDVFTYGIPPSAINLMVKVKGIDFELCFSHSVFFEEDGLYIRTLNLNNLVEAKIASGRPKDLDDIENLKRIKE